MCQSQSGSGIKFIKKMSSDSRLQSIINYFANNSKDTLKKTK